MSETERERGGKRGKERERGSVREKEGDRGREKGRECERMITQYYLPVGHRG